MFEMRCREKGLEWSLESAVAPGAVLGDEGKLRQVLINLLGNAVKFTDGGHIRLACGRQGERTLFAVEDSGVGIEDGLQADIFDPFRQGEGPGREGGSGLGLAIARRHVDLMGGELRLESESGRGSVFSFSLRLPPATGTPQPRDRWERVERLAGGRRLHALIVDDVETNRDVLAQLLGRVGVECETASSGARAIEAVRARRPDIVFMDITMPGMDGRQTLRALAEEHGGLAAVAVTASVFEHQRQEYLGLGFRAVLDKPVRAARLYACLAEQLGVEFDFAGEGAADGARDEAGGGRPGGLPAELPDELLDELRQAAEGHNITRLRPALDRLKELGPSCAGLAARLEEAVGRYDMESAGRLLDDGPA